MTSVASLLAMLRARKGKLPFEVGAFIALQAAEKLVEQPAEATLESILIEEDGSVIIDEAATLTTGEQTAFGLHRVLEQLLLAAGAGVPSRMLEYVDHGAPRGPDALERLRDVLESSLVPLNRAASKRVIARVLRDAERESAPPLSRRPPAFTEAQVDADLDALMGGGDAAPATRAPAQQHWPRAPEPTESPKAQIHASRDPGAAHHAPEPVHHEKHEAEIQKARAEREEREPTGSFVYPPKKKKSAAATAVTIIAALLAVGGFMAIVKPSLFGLDFGPRPAPEEDAGVAVRPDPRPAARSGTLTVNVPDGAQVLMFVGRGPARVEKLPIGVAHELVVIADGRKPSRTVLPRDATWPAGQPRPVYELALQAGDEAEEAVTLDIGASQLTAGNMGAASGRLGDIRVITNPPASKVYLMVGFGPQVVVRGLEVDAATELLVYAPRMEPERVVVAPSDYAEGAEGLAAETTVALRPRARGR